MEYIVEILTFIGVLYLVWIIRDYLWGDDD